MPMFNPGSGVTGEQIAEQLQKMAEKFNNMDKEEQALLGDPGDGSDGGGGGAARQIEYMQDMLKTHRKIWLDVAKDLDDLSTMQVRKQRTPKKDPMGNQRRVRPILDPAEVSSLHPSELALPKMLRLARIANNEAMVTDRVIYVDKQMLLYMICDCSGSMNSRERIGAAGGIILNRLKAVVRGDAQLFFRFFESSLKKEHEVTTTEQARKLLETQLDDGRFHGGGTAIAHCATKAERRIQQLVDERDLVRPELVIVTDGQDDTSGLRPQDFKSRVHVFMCGGHNEQLLQFARETGGVAANINVEGTGYYE